MRAFPKAIPLAAKPRIDLKRTYYRLTHMYVLLNSYSQHNFKEFFILLVETTKIAPDKNFP